MSVGIVAGEEGAFAPGGSEEGAADATESELAGGGCCFGGGDAGESALELADALAEGGVAEVEQPADLLAGVAGESQQGGEAEAWRKIGKRRLPGGNGLGAMAFVPACLAPPAAAGGAGIEGGAVAENAGKPAAGLGRREVGSAGFKGSEKCGLQEIVRLLRPAREAAGLRVQVCEGAGGGHGWTLPQSRDCGNGPAGS